MLSKRKSTKEITPEPRAEFETLLREKLTELSPLQREARTDRNTQFGNAAKRKRNVISLPAALPERG